MAGSSSPGPHAGRIRGDAIGGPLVRARIYTDPGDFPCAPCDGQVGRAFSEAFLERGPATVSGPGSAASSAAATWWALFGVTDAGSRCVSDLACGSLLTRRARCLRCYNIRFGTRPQPPAWRCRTSGATIARSLFFPQRVGRCRDCVAPSRPTTNRCAGAIRFADGRQLPPARPSRPLGGAAPARPADFETVSREKENVVVIPAPTAGWEDA